MNKAYNNEKWRVHIKIVHPHEGVHKKCSISISNYQIHETSWQCYDTAVQ